MTEGTDAKTARERLSIIHRVCDLQDRILFGSLDEAMRAGANLATLNYRDTAEASWTARDVLGTPDDGSRDFHSVKA